MPPITWTNCQVRLGDLKKWEGNPAEITKEAAGRLLDSFNEFGQVMTLAIDPENRLVDGHQRLDVWLAKFGADFVADCRRASRMLTEKERQKIAVYLRSGAVGRYSWDVLSGWDADDLKGWGFDASTLKDWQADTGALKAFIEANEPEVVDAEPQIDRAAELLEKWGVQTGDLWQIGEHRLLCGDCTTTESRDRLFEGRRVQLGITSPPYAVGKEYEEGITFEAHLALLRGLADRALEIIEPGGFFFVNFGEIAALSHASPLTGSKRQCIYLISKDYWQIFHEERRMDLYAQRIWYKPFGRLQQPFWSYHTSIPHHQEWEHIWTWRLPGGDGDKVHDFGVSVRAVWNYSTLEGVSEKPLAIHCAAFPTYIPENALKAHSDPGAHIWEPFSGSGTTMLVCQNMGRICYGTELDPKYCAVILERMNTAFPDLKIEKIDG